MTVYRPRWSTDATGYVARMAGEWAGPEFTDLDALTDLVRQMPNGGQVEIVTITEETR